MRVILELEPKRIPLRMHMAARHDASGKPAHHAAVARTPVTVVGIEGSHDIISRRFSAT